MNEPHITLPCSVVREAIAALDEVCFILVNNAPSDPGVRILRNLRRAVWAAALQRFLDCFGYGGE